LNALAFIVVVELTAIGPEYAVEEDDGVDPSVVYRIVAPEVAHAMITFWDEE